MSVPILGRSLDSRLLTAAPISAPVSLLLGHVPDDARDELAARAARSGRSLQEYLRAELIELARRPEPEALLEYVREPKHCSGSRLRAEAILAHRDADRR